MSFLLHNFIDLLFNNFKNLRKEILIICDDSEKVNKIKDYIQNSKSSFNYKFKNLPDVKSKKFSVEPIIIELKRKNIIKIKSLKDFLINGDLIYTSANWFAKEFQRIPSFLINVENLFDETWHLNNTINSFSGRIKRFGDIFLSSFIILISLPFVIVACIFIYLEDKGTVFYSQKRIGISGQEFKIFKLRTMCIEAEKDGPRWASKEDKRITNIGRILRKTRLDELPQLLSVLKGEMSLIGPRPERREIEEMIEKDIPHYYLRHIVRPGLSGWAQVNYHYGSSVKDSEIKLSFDLYYIKKFSIWLDLLIFIKTIKVVFTAKGSVPK